MHTILWDKKVYYNVSNVTAEKDYGLFFNRLEIGTTIRVRNLKFATYLKFATCENTNKINELW